MKISYNWLKWYIPDVPEPEKLSDIFTYHVAEVESVEKKDGDSIFDIKILPNRAHDLLSHQGIAREVASLLGITFNDPTSQYKVPESKATNLNIDVRTYKCRRYMARIVRNFKVGESPKWVVDHLASIGQRSINNAVDAANLVMYDCGQPIHVFDLDKLREEGLIIREALDGEEFTTLDNKEVKLKSGELVIADSKNILGLAGVKGGKVAEVDVNTKNIIIEVANFDPVSVRKSARGHALLTDAAKRFENEPTPELCEYAMREISGLFIEYGAVEFEDIVDVYSNKSETQELVFSRERISGILGVDISSKDISEILDRYGFRYLEKDGKFTMEIPAHRPDLSLEEDMAEEIGRIIGYDKVKPKLPKIKFETKVNDTFSKISFAREKLLGDGYSEVMTYAFSEKGEVGVMESASDKKFLRKNLADGLMQSLNLNKLNAPLLGNKETKIFEIGTVWTPAEEIHVAYSDKNSVKEKTLEEFISSEKDFFESLEKIPRSSKNPSLITHGFNLWSLYPFISRDIAVWVPEGVGKILVENLIKENAGDLVVRGPELFDEFKKDGKVSYAFRIVFQSFDRTLTDAEINEQMDRVVGAVEKQGWQVR